METIAGKTAGRLDAWEALTTRLISVWQVGMKLLLTYVLAVGLIAAAVQEEANAEICVFEKLDPEDSKICK